MLKVLKLRKVGSEPRLIMHNSSASVCCRGTPPLLPSEKGNLQRLRRSLHKMELRGSPADAPPGRHRARAQLPAVPGPPSVTPSRASSFSMPALLSSGDDNLKVVAAHTHAACFLANHADSCLLADPHRAIMASPHDAVIMVRGQLCRTLCNPYTELPICRS